mgnify:CR=1 FL=1
MKISNVTANIAVNPQNNLIAYASVVFDDCFIVRGIRVVERSNGTALVVMPSRQSKSGLFKEICHPLNRLFRELIEAAVMEKVKNLKNEPAKV